MLKATFGKLVVPVLLGIFCFNFVNAQYVTGKGNDASMPLHLMKPDYDIPYGETTTHQVKGGLDRVYNYLNSVTPTALINKQTGTAVDLSGADGNSILKQGDFRLTSYEWGVT